MRNTVVACGAIVAVSGLVWILRDWLMRGTRINAEVHAIFADSGAWLAALNQMDSTSGSLPTSGSILVCNPDTGQQLRTLSKPRQYFFNVFPVRGKDQFVSLSVDSRLGGEAELAIIRWDARTGQAMDSTTLDRQFRMGAIHCFVLSPDAERVYSVRSVPAAAKRHMPKEMQFPATLTCWESSTGEELFVLREDSDPPIRLNSLVFDGEVCVMAAICESQMIVVWDAVTGEERWRLTGVEARQLALSERGDSLVATVRGDNVRCWDLASKEELTSIAIPLLGKPASIGLSPDGRTMRVSDGERTIETWDLMRGIQRGTYKLDKRVTDGIANVAFSPNGKLLAAVGRELTGEPLGWRTYDAHLFVWDLTTGKRILQSTFSPGRGGHRLIFQRDGKRLLVAGDQAVWLWQLPVH